MKSSLYLLRNRNFVAYWASALVSGLGDQVFLIALNWMVIESTGSAWLLGLLNLAMGAPLVALSMFAGVFVDRVDPRRLMILSHWLRFGLMTMLVLLGLGGTPPLWSLFVTAFLFGVADAFFWPAASAVRQRLVPPEELVQSNSYLMIAAKSTETLGPLLGGGLMLLGGGRMAILLNGLSFLFGIWCLAKMKLASPERGGERVRGSYRQELGEGIRFVLRSPLLLATSGSAFLVNASASAALLAVPLLANELGVGVTGYSQMNAGLGIGGAVGAVLFALLAVRNPTPRKTLLACLLQGLLFLGIGLTGQLWLVILLLACIGVTETAINVIAPSVNQRIIPQAMFGRVISITILLMSGSVPLAHAGSGWLIDRIGAQELILGCGLLEIIVAVAAFGLPAIRRFGREEASKQLAL